eukprot:9160967-Lingulodinium_polyedra.AAC.1
MMLALPAVKCSGPENGCFTISFVASGASLPCNGMSSHSALRRQRLLMYRLPQFSEATCGPASAHATPAALA